MSKKWFLLVFIAPILYIAACNKTKVVEPEEPDVPEDTIPYEPPVTSDLIISEVSVISRTDIPGTGNQRNTYIELYNGTNAPIDLADYVMLYSKNAQGWGDDPGDTLFMTGTLAHGECYVILRDGVDAGASTFPTTEADIIWDNLKANGDDGIALAKTDGMSAWNIIDVFGSDVQPSDPWPMCGVTEGSIDVVLQRKYETAGPTTDWDASSGVTGTCQWDSYVAGTYDNVKHPTGFE